MTNPDASPFGSTWYGATMVAVPERGRLTHDLDVHVCVIGGGLAGLTVAREVARRGWSVAVLEAERIAWNASGRNGGFVLPGFAERIEAIVARVGLERAKELWTLSTAGVEYVRAAIRDAGMPGVAPVDGFLKPSRTDQDAALVPHVSMMQQEFAAEVELWPTDRVRDTLQSTRYFQALHWPGAFHIHPLNYAFGLAAAAEQAGARIFEASPAVAIDTGGVRKRIDTPMGRVRAHHIVLAGGPHLGALVPAVAETVVPVATYVGTTAPLGDRLLDAIRYQGAVADTRLACDFYRVVDGDRLLWGGGIGILQPPRRWLAHRIARWIRRVYPQLGPLEITYAWSGLMGYAVHKMPQIGELSNGVWLTGAFGGHGLNTTAMAGDLIARAIVEGDDRWRLFSSYELVWAGGRSGRAAAQVLFCAKRGRDIAAETIARGRDRLRRAAAERAVPPLAYPEDAAEAAGGVAAEAPEWFAADESEASAAGDESRETLLAEQALSQLAAVYNAKLHPGDGAAEASAVRRVDDSTQTTGGPSARDSAPDDALPAKPASTPAAFVPGAGETVANAAAVARAKRRRIRRRPKAQGEPR